MCQPIQRDRDERKPDEIDFGPGKTPFQNIEFANNILFEGNEQFDYYKGSDIINVQTIGDGTTATFNLSKIPGDASKVGEYTLPAVGLLMSFAEKDLIKDSLNTYNTAGLASGITVD